MQYLVKIVHKDPAVFTCYPHIRECVEDESEIFVIDASDPQRFWKADEFFLVVAVDEFEVK